MPYIFFEKYFFKLFLITIKTITFYDIWDCGDILIWYQEKIIMFNVNNVFFSKCVLKDAMKIQGVGWF